MFDRVPIRVILLLAKNQLVKANFINDINTQNAHLVSFKRLFTLLQSSASRMSLLNKLQELQSRSLALALSPPFLFALNPSHSCSNSIFQ